MKPESETTPLLASKNDGVPIPNGAVENDLTVRWWCLVDLMFVVWSILVVFDIHSAVVHGTYGHVLYGNKFYFAWNLARSFAWIFQIWCTVLDARPTCFHIIQLLVGLYFICDSVAFVSIWGRIDEGGVSKQPHVLCGAIVSTVAYFWVFLVTSMQVVSWIQEPKPAAENHVFADRHVSVEANRASFAEPLDLETMEFSVDTTIAEDPESADIHQEQKQETPTKTTTPLSEKFPQFFNIQEGKRGWGHASKVFSRDDFRISFSQHKSQKK